MACEFIILEGEYVRRKIWGLIGLHSSKGSEWGNIGRSLIKAILNSARGFCENDNSPEAQNARKINGFADLDGIEFVAKITAKKDQSDDMRNEIRFAITPDNKDYKSIMGMIPRMTVKNQQQHPNSQPELFSSANNRPAWAK